MIYMYIKPQNPDMATRSMPTLNVLHGVIGASVNPTCLTPKRRISPITITLVATSVFAAAYAMFHRVGTTANADTVEFTRNLTGGFLAIGMTDEQAGFVALSRMDQADIELHADQDNNTLAGTHTIVDIQTPSGTTHIRLRGPKAILISKQGEVEALNIDWTVDEFNTIRQAIDCSGHSAYTKKRCGAPFTDLHLLFTQWQSTRIPDRIHAFLKPYEDCQTHLKN